MKLFTEIAGRYGINTNNDIEVDKFYERIFPTLPDEEKLSILKELLEYVCEEKND